MTLLEKSAADAIAMFQAIQVLAPVLETAATLVGECLLQGGKLLVCGNGGSAADGADFATEFTCRFLEDRRPFPAINLSACGSLLSATGNDYGFEQVFARQVHAFGREGDVLVALSTSGNSPNILAALAAARATGVRSLALLGRSGGQAAGWADLELIIPSHTTARIQEGQKFLLHVLCEMVETRYLQPH